MSIDIRKLPHNKAILYDTKGEITIVEGPFDDKCLKTLLECEMFQMVPCTVGSLAGKAELWMNEEGFELPCNKNATSFFCDQVYGGYLRGNVLLVHCGAVE
tara:strand:+ start:46 stop:348 length:303 start_codon:yes stop_codon:yes gene_type:complete